MTREFCRNCICLVTGNDGEWICDEVQKEVEDIMECPEQPKTRTLNLTCICQCWYNSSIEVPADLSFKEAIDYARERLNEVPLGELEYIDNSDELDEENCDFE